VIGGIIASTVLSLVIVPAFFLIMDDLSRLMGWLFSRMIGAKEEEPEEPPASELAERINRVGTENAGLRERLRTLEARIGLRAPPAPPERTAAE
jgi:hypothetical protein